MNPRVFREYDIRGDAERDFPDDFVADLGRADRRLHRATGRRAASRSGATAACRRRASTRR